MSADFKWSLTTTILTLAVIVVFSAVCVIY